MATVLALAICEEAIISWALKIFSNAEVEAILDLNASCEAMVYRFPALLPLLPSATSFSCWTATGCS